MIESLLLEIVVGLATAAIIGSISGYVAIRMKLASLDAHMAAKFDSLDSHIELLRNDYRQLAERIDSVVGKV